MQVLTLAQALERGSLRGPLARALSRAWAGAFEAGLARVARPLVLPPQIPVLAVGGATLGGSGKTSLAIACAERLASQGARVALVGHGFRARPRHARRVEVDDRLSEVGDEALACARSFSRFGARVSVVVAPRRAEAIDFAARVLEPQVLVLDGVLQTYPQRVSLSLLAVDALEPWGRPASTPPCGDLRAPAAALLAACDLVVPVGNEGECAAPSAHGTIVSRGAWVAGVPPRRGIGKGVGMGRGGNGGKEEEEEEEVLLPWRELKGLRVGLLCALARPERLLRSLSRRGVYPELVVRVRDHGPLGQGALDEMSRRREVDLWLASPKCGLHLREVDVWRHALAVGVGVIDFALELSPALCSRLASLL